MNDRDVERATIRRVGLRLLPILFLLYIFAYLDRSNVSVAALQMNGELGFGPSAFGLGAGIFFLGYALFEVPSNLLLARVGARRWLARIAVTWGLLACALTLVRTPSQFYVTRFLLGVAEAGFFPGVIYYLSGWIPTYYRARAIAGFAIAVPFALAIGGPLGGIILGFSGHGNLSGWQWLFLIEGLPSIVLGIVALFWLTERPADARWLSTDQRQWLLDRLEQEAPRRVAPGVSPLKALSNPLVWLLSVPYFTFYTVGLGYVLWGPILVRDALGTSNAGTGLVTGTIALLSALFYPLSGWLSDRRDDPAGVTALGLTLQCAGCVVVALTSDPILRVGALAVISIGSGVILSPFWCLPTKFLQGSSAAAGIALISAIGSSGGFFGPSIIGYFKQVTGQDNRAFIGLAGLALIGIVVCMGLRRRAAFKPSPKPAPVAQAAVRA